MFFGGFVSSSVLFSIIPNYKNQIKILLIQWCNSILSVEVFIAQVIKSLFHSSFITNWEVRFSFCIDSMHWMLQTSDNFIPSMLLWSFTQKRFPASFSLQSVNFFSDFLSILIECKYFQVGKIRSFELL